MKKRVAGKKLGIFGAVVLAMGVGAAAIVAAPRLSAPATSTMNTTEMDITLNAEMQNRKVMPGEEYEFQEPLSVANTGDYVAYLRVRVNKSWYNGGEKMTEGDVSFIELKEIAEDSKWVVAPYKAEDEDIYLYYRKPVDPGKSTGDFLAGYKIGDMSNSKSNLYAEKEIHINVEADGVQVPRKSDGAVDVTKVKDAILSEWGLKVQDINTADGTIIDMEVD